MGNPFSGSAGHAPNATNQLADLYKAYTSFLPGMQNVSNQQLLPTALSQLNTGIATAPIQNALNLQQLDQYGLPTAGANSAITNQNALMGAGTNLATLLGPGGASALVGSALTRAANPNYASVADNSARQTNNALNAINLNGLSPGEYNATERSLNQSQTATGNLGLDNATNALTNATNFGGAFNSKIGLLNNTLGTASGVGNMLENNGFNAVGTALSAPSPQYQSTFGSGTFGTTGTNGQNNLSVPLLGTSGNITGGTTAPIAQSNYMNSAQGTFGVNAGACCFIFLESYHGKMPEWVRKCRDKYYTRHPQIAKGYKRLAKILVPAMRHSQTVRALVWEYMVWPMTLHGYNIVYGGKSKYRKTRSFWMKTWYVIGGI